MSWSLYFNAKSSEAARTYVAKQKEQGPETPYAMPAAAKDLILAAIDLVVVTTEGVGLKIEAAGHSPNGSCSVKVEPFVLVE